MTETPRILVIKLSAFGDFIQALGAMKAVREHHKDAHITLLTTSPFEKFGKLCGYFDDILIDRRPKWYDLKGWMALRKALNGGNFTRVYDLQNNDRTGLYFKMLREPKPEWAGMADGASHQNTSPLRREGHAFDYHKATLALTGIKNVRIDTLDWISADITTLSMPEKYVLLVPGSAPQHPQKRWPAEHYAALAQKLIDNGTPVAVIGTEAEKETTNQIKALCPDVIDLNGRTSIEQIAVLARSAAGAIGNDTGPMHIIAPTGCPSLVLFSAHSNPKRHLALGAYVSYLQKDDLKDLNAQDVYAKLTLR